MFLGGKNNKLDTFFIHFETCYRQHISKNLKNRTSELGEIKCYEGGVTVKANDFQENVNP